LTLPETPIGLRIRVGSRRRDPEEYPEQDDALGEALFGKLLEALQRGVPPPALLLLRQEVVELVDLRPLLEGGHAVDRFIAAAAGQDGVQAAALLAVLSMRERGRPVGRAAVAFVEWSDNRWWQAYQLLNQGFKALDDMPPVQRRAVDGFPRPAGLGGWFSTARFLQLKLRLQRDAAAIPPGSQLVH